MVGGRAVVGAVGIPACVVGVRAIEGAAGIPACVVGGRAIEGAAGIPACVVGGRERGDPGRRSSSVDVIPKNEACGS